MEQAAGRLISATSVLHTAITCTTSVINLKLSSLASRITQLSKQTAKMVSQEEFDKAAEEAKALPKNTSNDDQLILYGLFKQSNVGDCNTKKPGMLDMKGKAKWEAWNKLQGKSKEDAMTEYVAKVASLKAAA
eukprot:CAMPEP_0206149346 /NCGR_PEP_ID=MMETSP1473-20131121/37732_1 /ASSEMBLY_ACC=CAM_ASM_001109 /TAXON_ID=1461547 /ORGANISM="Stichococcus sp, Strain RCC1054" /LENGTH=132 /DNA_ID=CAMNT_0053546803 /DNA_START=449 /DNA_END=847 /DNA_ORIENTATION=-